MILIHLDVSLKHVNMKIITDSKWQMSNLLLVKIFVQAYIKRLFLKAISHLHILGSIRRLILTSPHGCKLKNIIFHEIFYFREEQLKVTDWRRSPRIRRSFKMEKSLSLWRTSAKKFSALLEPRSLFY